MAAHAHREHQALADGRPRLRAGPVTGVRNDRSRPCWHHRRSARHRSAATAWSVIPAGVPGYGQVPSFRMALTPWLERET